jgi:hypothetical protein
MEDRVTLIKEFVVILPQNNMEKFGERLKLSIFGEYCPPNSLRGYQLKELLTKSHAYKPKIIIQKGVEVILD